MSIRFARLALAFAIPLLSAQSFGQSQDASRGSGGHKAVGLIRDVRIPMRDGVKLNTILNTFQFFSRRIAKGSRLRLVLSWEIPVVR